jgi:enoyl-CoA hydratase/carnithine racemase
MLDEFAAKLIELDQEKAVRAIVITGASRGFCAGLDLQDATAGSGIGLEKRKPDFEGR